MIDKFLGFIESVFIPIDRRYIQEHRLVMERKLGRKLESEEVVHHINLDPSDNSIENLLLLKNSSQHGMLHGFLQLALVRLLEPSQMRDLTLEIVDNIQRNGKPIRSGRRANRR